LKNSLNSIELLIDDKEVTRKSWEVPRALFNAFPGRVTYVIGSDGIVKSIYDDIAKAELHPDKALEALKALKPTASASKSPFSFKF
jgi:thioredoxin-dependent peroxiredoxin